MGFFPDFYRFFVYDVYGVHSFFASFEFEFDFVAFLEVLGRIAGVEEVFIGGVDVFYESESFGGVVVFYPSFVNGELFGFFLLGNGYDDVLRVDFFFFLEERRLGGDASVCIDIGDHVVE